MKGENYEKLANFRNSCTTDIRIYSDEWMYKQVHEFGNSYSNSNANSNANSNSNSNGNTNYSKNIHPNPNTNSNTYYYPL